MKLRLSLVLLCMAAATSGSARACIAPVTPCARATAGSFALIRNGMAAKVYIDADADKAVQHVADSFVEDLGRVGAVGATRVADLSQAKGDVVIIGVLGQSPVIDRLVASGRIAAADIAGKWEAYRQVVIDRPLPNIPRALLIIGADRRGAVFGTYDISTKIGVSPWYWWADVPVRKQRNLHLTAGARSDAPRVKYRGFFINDEDPSFKSWATEKFGGVNSKLYEHVFELDLRLKGNYLWPAMWGKAFADDDPRSMVLADEMGVIMGTSHHEPMTRAQAEWHRNTDKGVTGGAWDYTTNAANLRTFWRGGIERMMSKGDGQAYEHLVTIGMRGDGDEPMAEGTATQLLETIVADQRRIIAELTGKPAAQTPQVWALYKEVQDYYDHGMKVPDDVLLLFADDNWGQIRRLPVKDRDRKGGYGVYYHFDYVGGPRNYKWLNTNQIEKTWQQMDLAYRSGADDLWIVNVGDIKPMEFPLSFFLDMAWDPEAMTPAKLAAYPRDWAAATFGEAHAAEIAGLLARYAQLAARRKPELIDATSFRLGAGFDPARDGGEFGAMLGEWQGLEKATLAAKRTLAPDQRDAYFQLVEHPVLAMTNLYRLYYAVAWNRRLADANNPRANGFADQAEAAFRRDGEISAAYHRLNRGKWNGMMLQTHIGYTTWQQPETQVMPEVRRVASGRPVAESAIPVPAQSSGEIVAIDAASFARATGGKGLSWQAISDLGRTAGAILALPQGRAATTVEDGIRLEYDVRLARAGDAVLQLYMVPTLDTRGIGGIRIAVSIDDRPAQTLRFDLIPNTPAWNQAVRDNAHILSASFPTLAAGSHRIIVWRIDDNAVLQKLVLATGAVPPSYLGPDPARR